MTEIQVELIIAIFEDEDVASDTLKELKELKGREALDFEGAADVRRDEHGRLHIKELGDSQGGRGAAIGGAIGATLGLLAGPAGLVVGGVSGAWIGAVAEAWTDTGIPDDSLREIGDLITAGTSAVVVMAEAKWSDEVRDLLVAKGGTLVTVDDTGGSSAESESVTE